MSIFSRFADIVNSNISALLDKAEDPQKMIRLIIQEMEDTLVEVRTHSAKSIADQKELTRKIDSLDTQIEDWSTKATLALSKQREDLARAALIEKQKVESLVAELKSERTLVEETIDKLSDEIAKLETKIVETRARQQALKIREGVAGNRKNVQRHLHRGQSESTSAKFEQYARKIDELEAEADMYAQTGEGRNLEQEFANLKAQDEIEKELERMKAEMRPTENNQ